MSILARVSRIIAKLGTIAHVQAEPFVILTDGAPAYPDRVRAVAPLALVLDALGYEYTMCEGMYQGKPDGTSYIVPGMDTATGAALGRRYGQESVIAREGLVYCDSLRTVPYAGATLMGEAARAEDYSSTLQDGTCFSLLLDWSAGALQL